VAYSHSSKARLTWRDLGRYPADSLFDRIGRAVCAAGCVPRKELYEAWEVARRVRRRFRGGRVVDLCAGHGLLGQLLLILDDSSPEAVAVDTAIPPSAGPLHDALAAAWPRLDGRVRFAQGGVDNVAVEKDDLVVASHACGALTDAVLDAAAAAGARVAVLPCCHNLSVNDEGPLSGWLDGTLAIDVMRVVRLQQRGYRVWTHTIAADVTPKGRLLIAERSGGIAQHDQEHA
jgi:hypothetical protein